jgi:hypothetical protein
MLVSRVQSLFELGGNRMDGPVAVIREFVQPLVDRAISQQAQRHAQARLREDATTGETCCSTLLDHLVDTLDGEFCNDREKSKNLLNYYIDSFLYRPVVDRGRTHEYFGRCARYR